MLTQLTFRNASPEQLADFLLDARNYTLALFDSFLAADMDQPAHVPCLPIINPPLWELGHVAWFAEWFVLREAQSSQLSDVRRPSILSGSDLLFDSNTVPHDTRWSLSLPDADIIMDYAENVLTEILSKLQHCSISDLYRYRLALAHEDMHGEAYAYTLQTLGLAAPQQLNIPVAPSLQQEDISFTGGILLLGSRPDAEFVFDNEKWGHEVFVPGFSIQPTLVSNAQFRAFILDGGYQDRQHWRHEGLAWLIREKRIAPRYWQHTDGRWQCERFGALTPLPDGEAVRHVTFYEAQAYCSWSGRRLLTEVEWEYAARSGNTDFCWGDLWEWTNSNFLPYPGFSADMYQEYSIPWFNTHQVLRGASFATRPRMRAPCYRNFYMPERDDIFAGFRTCAL